jgi:hypothetical protein
VEEVKLLLVALVLTGSAAASTNDPFDRYMASVKHHQPEARLQEFAKSCGVSIEKTPVYGVGPGGGWTRTANLAKGVYDTESDFFSTAAIWSVNGLARLIDFWSLSLDVGSEINVLYCLASSGDVRAIEVVNNSVPVEKGDAGGWIYEQREKFDENGKVIEKTGRFIDEYGKSVKKPKLGADVSGSFDWIPDASLVPDLEKALLTTKDSK